MAVQRRVLIVDDEPFNLMSIKTILASSLKKLNHNPNLLRDLIDEANDGAQAVQQVKDNLLTPYGLIISDCQMPEMDGY